METALFQKNFWEADGSPARLPFFMRSYFPEVSVSVWSTGSPLAQLPGPPSTALLLSHAPLRRSDDTVLVFSQASLLTYRTQRTIPASVLPPSRRTGACNLPYNKTDSSSRCLPDVSRPVGPDGAMACLRLSETWPHRSRTRGSAFSCSSCSSAQNSYFSTFPTACLLAQTALRMPSVLDCVPDKSGTSSFLPQVPLRTRRTDQTPTIPFSSSLCIFLPPFFA